MTNKTNSNNLNANEINVLKAIKETADFENSKGEFTVSLTEEIFVNGLSPHRIAGYLSDLQSKDLVNCRDVGRVEILPAGLEAIA